MSNFDSRAIAVFGRADSGGVLWPYEVSGPDIALRRDNPTLYEQQQKVLTSRRQAMLEWAEQHGLKRSTVQCCPWWLTRKASRQCPPLGRQCTRYGTATVDRSWLDHGLCWLKGGRPAAITSSPYQITESDRERLTWWSQTDPRLTHDTGTGWYVPGTTQIVMWRTDLIETVEPCSGIS